MNRIHPISQHKAYRSRKWFNSLPGIRAIAILAVLWHHTEHPISGLPITSRGFLGVDLFFVLSGFLIVTIMLRERERNGDISLKNFFIRRFLRLFPLYYGLLFVLLIAFGIVFRNSDAAAAYISAMPWYFTYTSNFIREETLLAVAWSLATEEQFYLVWPPIEKFLSRFALPILAVLIIINQLINYRIILAAHHARLEVLQSTFTPILLGILVAHMLHNKVWYERIAAVFGNKWMTLITAAALLVLMNVFPLGTDISGTPRLMIHLWMTAFLTACVVNEDHVLKPLFTLKPLMRIGDISYGMYLFHMFVVAISAAVLGRLGLSGVPMLLFISTLIGTIIISEISFRFYESPFLKLKERWAAHKPAQAATPPIAGS